MLEGGRQFGCSSGRTYFILSKRFGSLVGSMLAWAILLLEAFARVPLSVVFGLSIVRWLTLFWLEIINRAQYTAEKWRDRERKQIWSAWFSPLPYLVQFAETASSWLNERTVRESESKVLKDFGNFNKTLIIIDTQVELQNEAFAQIRLRRVSVCMERARSEGRAGAVPTHNPATWGELVETVGREGRGRTDESRWASLGLWSFLTADGKPKFWVAMYLRGHWGRTRWPLDQAHTSVTTRNVSE